TNASGYYEFDDLTPGDYKVMEVLPDGSYNLTDVTVDLDGNVSGFDETVNFVNTKYGKISGYKYHDDDGDETTTDDQTGWEGVTIDLLDDGGNVIATTLTNANGYYEFKDLVPGDYSVREVLPDGSYNLTDITVDLNGNVSGFDVTADFANTLYGMISGTKYEDSDGDINTTGDRVVWSGVTITLLDADMNEVASTDTNASGYYEFKDLELGTYYVKETQPDGSSAISEIQVEVTGATSGFSETADFVNFRDMSISGYKWADTDSSETWSEGEGTLDGWTIYLDNDFDPTNGYIEAVVTGAGEWEDGYYEFTGINTDDPLVAAAIDGTGMLYVYEAVEPGFTQTYGDFSFLISSGLSIDGDLGVTEQGNFGNWMMEGAVRTPGFWQSTLGQSLYNGIEGDEGDANGDGIPDGDKDFDAEGWSEVDLLSLFGVDTDGQPGNDEFAIWDVNGNGVEDAGDIFLTPEELLNWVDGGEKGGGRDYVTILERDLGAAFLNTINNAAINGSSDPEVDPAIADYYADAVAFILDWDANFDGVSSGSKKAQASDWKDYGSEAHGVLGAYNEGGEGMVEGTMMQVAMDGDDYSSLLVQNYLAVEGQMVA
ncbi:MSCRAMM family protein, partial [Croceicoccus gelatinilyticus]|uniref:MSCRAMM family protein n=1 Tax=Croceicoccus gelatinilyticus TaxID=2835536 RepID=UPI001BCE84E2